MIIDSHAHYNNNAYKKPFRYLSYDKGEYALKEGDREQLFQELLDPENTGGSRRNHQQMPDRWHGY